MADVIALSDGYVASILFSEIELLADTYPDLMRKASHHLLRLCQSITKQPLLPSHAFPTCPPPSHTLFHCIHPQFNNQLARAAVEEELADSGLYLEDLQGPELQRQIDALLKKKRKANWKGRHDELVALREGLYASLDEETADDPVVAQRKGLGGTLRDVFRRKRRASTAQAVTL